MSSTLGKILYDAAADGLRGGEVVVHDFLTWSQLASVEGNTLRAPEGQLEDRADAFCLAVAGRLNGRPTQVHATKTRARGILDRLPKGF